MIAIHVFKGLKLAAACLAPVVTIVWGHRRLSRRIGTPIGSTDS